MIGCRIGVLNRLMELSIPLRGSTALAESGGGSVSKLDSAPAEERLFLPRETTTSLSNTGRFGCGSLLESGIEGEGSSTNSIFIAPDPSLTASAHGSRGSAFQMHTAAYGGPTCFPSVRFAAFCRYRLRVLWGSPHAVVHACTPRSAQKKHRYSQRVHSSMYC